MVNNDLIFIKDEANRDFNDNCQFADNPTKLDFSDLSKSIEQRFETNHDEAFSILENCWIERFCLSEMSDADKVDALILSSPIFKKYEELNASPCEKYETFVKLVNSKRYLYAVKLSKVLALSFPERRKEALDIIRKIDVNSVFFDLDMEPGGVGSTIINRSNYLSKKGYKINLLSTDEMKDYKKIKDHFYQVKNLSRSVDIANIFDYYSEKNTFSDEVKKAEYDASDAYTVKEIENPDDSITYEYYEKENPSKKIKEELFINGVLVFRQSFNPQKEEYFTLDGYNYLNKDGKYFLNDRKTQTTIEFASFNEFLAHFINEYCDISNNKPFLINDNHLRPFNFNHVDADLTMQIASIHGNPYYKYGEPDIGPNRRVHPKVPFFKILNQLKAFVLLTDTMKSDLSKEFDFNRFVVIPNFILNEKLDYEPVEKDFDKIAIFSRLSITKNISDAIRAFKIVCDNNETARLEIYGRIEGSEEERNRLVNLSKELSIEDRVIFKGFIPNSDIEMRKSLVTLMNSYSEGFSMSLIESMANSTPVITYDTNYGPRDVIDNGVDGIIVEYGDYESMGNHILELLDNPQKAIEMGRNAKEKIESKFCAEVVCDTWENLLLDVYLRSENDRFSEILNREELANDNKAIKNDLTKLKNENKRLKDEKNEILNSRSWKISRPLRTITNFLRKIKNKVK